MPSDGPCTASVAVSLRARTSARRPPTWPSCAPSPPFVVAERPGDDTAAATAQGVAIAIRRALAQRHETVEGKRVLIQGVGRVGFALAELLARDGARLVVSDVDKAAVARARARR